MGRQNLALARSRRAAGLIRLSLIGLLGGALSAPALAQSVAIPPGPTTVGGRVSVQTFDDATLRREDCGPPSFTPTGEVFWAAGPCAGLGIGRDWAAQEQVAAARRDVLLPAEIRTGDPNLSPHVYHGTVSHPVVAAPAVAPMERGVDPSHFKENHGLTARVHQPVVHQPVVIERHVIERPVFVQPAPVVVLTPRRVRDVFTPALPAGCVQSTCNPCSYCTSRYAHPTYPTYAFGSAVEVIDTVPFDVSTIGYGQILSGLERGNALVVDKRRVDGATYRGAATILYRYTLQVAEGRLALISQDHAPLVGQCVAYDSNPLAADLRVVQQGLCAPRTVAQDVQPVGFGPGTMVPSWSLPMMGVGYAGPGPWLGHHSYGSCHGALTEALVRYPQLSHDRQMALEYASLVCALSPGDRFAHY